jgi:signal transduction histidine kinase
MAMQTRVVGRDYSSPEPAGDPTGTAAQPSPEEHARSRSWVQLRGVGTAAPNGALTGKRTRRLSRLIEPALAHLSLDDLLQDLLRRVCAFFTADCAAVLLCTPDGAALQLRAAVGGEPQAGAAVPLTGGVAGCVLAEGRALVADGPPFADASCPHPPDRPLHALMAVPVRVEGRVIGVLCVGATGGRRFSESDASLLQLAVDRVAVSIELARLLEAERAARAEADAARARLSFLLEASALLSGTLDYTTTLANLARLCVPLLADCCIVDMLEDDGTFRRLAVVADTPEREALVRALGERYPLDLQSRHPIAEAARARSPVLIPEVTAETLQAMARDDEHRALLARLGVRSRMSVPLTVNDRVLGVISFCAVQRRYGAEDLSLAEDLARRAATAIANARLYDEVRRALRLRDELMAAISHDLAQPLASIRTLAHVLHEEAESADRPDGVWMARRLDAIATRLTAMCREFVDLARLEAGQPLDLHCRPMDLVALVRQLAELHADLNRGTHEIRVDAAQPEIVGTWDKFRLERVVNNLLSNAIKYSPDGGPVHVTLTVVDEPLPEGGTRAYAQLTVQDHGVGIPAADLPHIFERFHRARNVVGRFKGNGLGLAGSRQIVEQHGGRMRVTSQEGQGSTFTVLLPLEPA